MENLYIIEQPDSGTNIYAANNNNKTNTQKTQTTLQHHHYYAISEHDDNQQYISQWTPECFGLYSRKSPITEAAYIKKLIECSIFCYLQIFTFYPLWSIQKQNYIISRTDEKRQINIRLPAPTL